MKAKLAWIFWIVLAFVAVRAGPVAAAATQTAIQIDCVAADGQTFGAYDVTAQFWRTNPHGSALNSRMQQVARLRLTGQAPVAVRTVRAGRAEFLLPTHRAGANAVYLVRTLDAQNVQPVVVVLPVVRAGRVRSQLTVYPKAGAPGPPLPDTAGSPPEHPSLPNTFGGNLPQTDGQWHRWLLILGVIIGALALMVGVRVRIQREVDNDDDE